MKRILVTFSIAFFLALPAMLPLFGQREAVVLHRPVWRGPAQYAPVQFKVCDHDANGVAFPCRFDSPVTAGSILAQFGVGGCEDLSCKYVSDSQGNDWKFIISGHSLAFNAKPGITTVYFNNMRWPIIAEYPCPSGACSLDDVVSATYADDGLTPAGVEIHDNAGWAGVHRFGSSALSPLETHESCELLLSWALAGQGTPVAGPSFTMRAYSPFPNDCAEGVSCGSLAVEDSTAMIPGYYMASMSWRYPNAWEQRAAAIRMGGCK